MSNKPALIVTIIIAVLAIVAVVFAVFVLNWDKSSIGGNTDENGEIEFKPDEALIQEATSEADRLVRDNYEVFKLFYLMPYDVNTHFEAEPYGNEPEDGYRSLKQGVIVYGGEEYNNIEQVFELVDNTFIESAAIEIKNYSTQTFEGEPVYKEREGKIGVNVTYSPMDYDLIWKDVQITLTFSSSEECTINATLAYSSGEKVEKRMTMLKSSDGIWRLENIFF